MRALNILRAVLVGCAFVATILLLTQGAWIPATVMGLGIIAHAGLWVYLRAERRKLAEDPMRELMTG